MFKFKIFIFIAVTFMVTCPDLVAQDSDRKIDSDSVFENKIRPLLQKFCADCHAPGDMEGLDFLAIEDSSTVGNHKELFASVYEQMASHAMPPKGLDQPSEAELNLITEWFKTSLDLKPGDTDRIAQYVVEIHQDQDGGFWFGTMQKGLGHYDGESFNWYSKKDGLPSNTVSSIVQDKDGTFWLGTHAGVCRYDGDSFAKIGTAQGLPASSRPSPSSWASVSVDRKGNVWASVGKKVYRYDGSTFIELKLPASKGNTESFSIVPGRTVLATEDRKGNLWFNTDGNGAYKYDGESFTHYTVRDGLCSNNVTSILEDKQGRIWFTCIQSYQPRMTGDGGVCRLDGDTIQKFPSVRGLGENDIYTLYETRAGDIWIGASGVGAYRYRDEKFTLFDQTNRQPWTRNFGVQDILEDRDGTLWFGFSGGLFRFDGASFFNVTEEGPWMSVASAMATIVANKSPGSNLDLSWLNADTQDALSKLAEGQIDQATSVLNELLAEQPNEPSVQEAAINAVGYQLIWDKQLPQAINVFRLNTQLYPQASNTFDSLAEAYHRKGDEVLAIENYRRSLKLDPKNTSAANAIRGILARQRYESALVAPDDWMEEVIICPPNFAPSMNLTGLEHLRLPPEFRKADSNWFMSYLFAIELTEAADVSKQAIGEQLLTYFRGLASGGSDSNGNKIDTERFSIEVIKSDELGHDEYCYALQWQEPFTNGTVLTQNLRVKVMGGKNQHGIVFVCGSPQSFESQVWTQLLQIRESFEAAPAPSPANQLND